MFQFKQIYFLGICGTLMGNFAVMLSRQGVEVRGSDSQFYPPISNLLENEDLILYKKFSIQNLDYKPDIVVIGNAISRGNVELEYILNNKINYISLPELIKYYFINKRDSIVVTGTHGKTTTTTAISNIFTNAGKVPSYIIGGIPVGMDKGFEFWADSKEVIIEGDEYDTAFFDKRSKFFHYKPKTLIINNIEYDHADIFNSIDDIKKSFSLLLRQIPSQGHIIANYDDIHVRDVCKSAFTEVDSYSINYTKALWQIRNIQENKGITQFDIYYKSVKQISLCHELLPSYQIYNFTAAVISALKYGINTSIIKETLNKFRGVFRRLQSIGTLNNMEILEDFAHHPTAIYQTLLFLRKKYSDFKLLAVFEPRSNTTRLNIFQNSIADALSLADIVIIGKINRKEKLSKEVRLDPDLLCDTINKKNKEAFYIEDYDDVLDKIKEFALPNTVCVVMSNGNFGNLIKKLRCLCQN